MIFDRPKMIETRFFTKIYLAMKIILFFRLTTKKVFYENLEKAQAQTFSLSNFMILRVGGVSLKN